jgi:hypothetical protein
MLGRSRHTPPPARECCTAHRLRERGRQRTVEVDADNHSPYSTLTASAQVREQNWVLRRPPLSVQPSTVSTTQMQASGRDIDYWGGNSSMSLDAMALSRDEGRKEHSYRVVDLRRRPCHRNGTYCAPRYLVSSVPGRPVTGLVDPASYWQT